MISKKLAFNEQIHVHGIQPSTVVEDRFVLMQSRGISFRPTQQFFSGRRIRQRCFALIVADDAMQYLRIFAIVLNLSLKTGTLKRFGLIKERESCKIHLKVLQTLCQAY